MEKHRNEHRIELMSRVLRVSVSGYYAWVNRKPAARSVESAKLTAEVKEIFDEHHQRYGSPRVYRELRARNRKVSLNRVAALMRSAGLVARKRRRHVCTTDSNHTQPIAGNILDRNFVVSQINRVWCGDITYIPTRAGFAYVAVVIDLCSRKVVGWHVSERIDARLVCMALWRAIEHRRKPKQAIARLFHSDQGVQYASKPFRHMLERFAITPSMSRKGNCWDNAPTESFFKTLKEETGLAHELPRDSEHVRVLLYRYIEFYYNRIRRHSSIGYISPWEFESRLIRG
ncbi:MAG: IS3 family transposase [Candidatus Kapaibacterium sp.]